jgi:hypothetical protein
MGLPGVTPVPPAVGLFWSVTGLIAGLPWFLSKRPVPERLDRKPLVLWSLASAGTGTLLMMQGKPALAAVAGAMGLAAWMPEFRGRRAGGA